MDIQEKLREIFLQFISDKVSKKLLSSIVKSVNLNRHLQKILIYARSEGFRPYFENYWRLDLLDKPNG
jgi:hypothetical protein